MARAKISEFRAKTMLYTALDRPYAGVSVDTAVPLEAQLQALPNNQRYVVKVDQAIKKRMKQGLVRLDRAAEELAADVQEFAAKGYRYCLIEPMFPHDSTSEHYLAFETDRDGDYILFSPQGGIDVESAADSVSRLAVNDDALQTAATALSIPVAVLQTIHEVFVTSFCTYLEINPLVSNNETPMLLDVAAVVDDEAAYLARQFWLETDFRTYRQQTPEEVAITELAAKSRASLRYEIINPDGAVWLLLSGGGASVTVADEVNNRGFGELLGNYGEYSGNPSEPETFGYTEQLLKSLLGSRAPRKVLVIAGGVANFTDVRTTFAGVIRAITAYADDLKAQGVKVYVRRGGPHEVEGLKAMHDFLVEHDLLGAVHGPELPLAESVTAGLASLETDHV